LELLIVVAIIGVLVALLLPAIQKARDASGRIKCGNNLKQIGLALHQYHDTQGSLPPGTNPLNPRLTGDYHYYWSWLARLLPYVEQGDLYRQAEAFMNDVSWNPWTPPGNPAQSQPVLTYQCPADERVFTSSFVFANPDTTTWQLDVAFTSFLGVNGRDFRSADGVLFGLNATAVGGVVRPRSCVGFRQVTDGLSNTLAVGERPPSEDLILGWWFDGQGQDYSGSSDVVLGVEELNVLYGDCSPGPYRYQAGNLRNNCDQFHFWSLHVGGANFLFLDGSVHFLPYSAQPLMLPLATRAGGEPVEF
jgi:prepilin-type processing-associated H-X9-DG protein